MKTKYKFIFSILSILLLSIVASASTTITGTQISSDQLTAGSTAGLSGLYPIKTIISNSDKTYYICDSAPANGCDYSLINDAIAEANILQRHAFKIRINGSDYTSNEDVFITGIYGMDIGSTTEGVNGYVSIAMWEGTTVPKINSVYASNVQGVNTLSLSKLNITGIAPYNNELAAVAAFSSDVSIVNVTFSSINSTAKGIMEYGHGVIKVNGAHFEGNHYSAYHVKRGGRIYVRDNGDDGTVNTYVAQASIGEIYLKNSNVVAPNKAFTDQGQVYDKDNNIVYGLNVDKKYRINGGTSTDIESGITETLSRNWTELVLTGEFTIDAKVDIDNVNGLNIDASAATFNNNNQDITFEITNTSNFKFNGGTFNLNSSLAASAGFIIFAESGESIENFVIDGITINNASNGIRLSSLGSDAIVKNIKITNNNFLTTRYSIQLNIYGTPLGKTEYVTISNNYMEFGNTLNTPSTSELMGIYIEYADINNEGTTNIEIFNNYIVNYYTTQNVFGVLIGSNSSTSKVHVDNNVFRNLICNGTNVAYGMRSLDVDEIFFTNNLCENIGFTGNISQESHCVLISGSNVRTYGKSAIITGNYVHNITTGSTGNNKVNSEGIYCKSWYCDVSNNILIDAGDSRAIVLKGDYNGTSAQMINNIVIYEDRQPRSGGISSSQDNTTISGNIVNGVNAAPAIEIAANFGFTYIIKDNSGIGFNDVNVIDRGIYGPSTGISNLYIEGNIFYGNVTGLYDSSENYTIKSNFGNFINGNAVDNVFNGNLNVSGNIYVDGCIQYNCSGGCITLGTCI